MAAPFTKAEVERALKGAKAAGVDVTRFKITKDGTACTIEIDTGKPPEPADNDLDKELQEFAARHGQD